MIHIDDNFDIFRMMDRLFGYQPKSNPDFIDYDKSERMIDDDNIYYTLALIDLDEEEVDTVVHQDKIFLTINKFGEEESAVELRNPHPIDVEKTVVKYNNGILDIIAPRLKKNESDSVLKA